MTEPYRYAPQMTGLDPMLGTAMNWLNGKQLVSQFPAIFCPKSPLPVLGQAVNGKATRALIVAINDRLGRLEYHSDPWGGAGDLYNHPEHTEWLLQHQGPNEKRPRDCDDFAVFAHALARKAGVKQEHVWIWNLIVANQFRDVKWNHVIVGMRCAEEPGKIYVLDTCSAAWKKPHEFAGDKWTVEVAVRRLFGEAYRDEKTGQPRQFGYLIDVPPPFLI